MCTHTHTHTHTHIYIPCRYEPCGLPQMYAQRYGTIPVVHATGGLKDSVEQYDPFEGKGTGWKFDRCDAEGVKFGLWHAIDTFKHHKEAWAAMKKRAMSKDFSWANAAKRCVDGWLAHKCIHADLLSVLSSMQIHTHSNAYKHIQVHGDF